MLGSQVVFLMLASGGDTVERLASRFSVDGSVFDFVGSRLRCRLSPKESRLGNGEEVGVAISVFTSQS